LLIRFCVYFITLYVRLVFKLHNEMPLLQHKLIFQVFAYFWKK